MICFAGNRDIELRFGATNMDELAELARRYRTATTLQERDVAAESIIRIVGPKLRAFLHNRLDDEDAEHVFSETLVQVVRKFHQCIGDTDRAVWAWFFQTAYRLMLKTWAKRKMDPLAKGNRENLEEVVERAARIEPLSAGERLDLEDAIKILNEARPPCGDLLRSFFIWGWSYVEIGAAYGKTANAVHVKLVRCLELAQEIIGGEE